MMRLRPSEITLSAADVDETRRRMARRQAVTPSAALSTRGSRLPARPPHGPRLRRGPDRSRDDAIRHLGDIPILRPQQGVHASTDDGDNAVRHRADSLQDEAESNDFHNVDAETDSNRGLSTPSPVHDVQLPFRPAPRSDVARDQLEQTPGQAASQNSADDLDTLTPRPPPPTVQHFGEARINTSEDVNEGLTQPRIQNPVDGSIEDRSVTTIRSGGTVLAWSPPHGQPLHGIGVTAENFDSEDTPTRYLQNHLQTPHEYRYEELVPHTDPPQRLSRLATRARALSSSSDPSQIRTTIDSQPYSKRQQGLSRPDYTYNEVAEISDIFQEPEGSRPHSSFDERMRRAHARAESIQERCRSFFGRAMGSPEESGSTSLGASVNRHSSQRFSQASSNSSLPYSYYELPGSRHSSSQSQGEGGEQLVQSQYDGAAPSRHVSPGVYYSIRPSQVRARNDVHPRPQINRVSSSSSPNLAVVVGQHGLSPLPTNPYARDYSPQNPYRPSLGLITPNDFVGNDHDAASAAQRDLVSPLEILGRRAAIQLDRVSEPMPIVPSRRPVPNAASIFQYQVEDFDTGEPRRRREPGSESIRQFSGNAAHNRVRTAGRNPIELPLVEPVHHRTERATIGISESRSHHSGYSDGRAGQRSSENVPVGTAPSQNSNPTSRATQSQAHISHSRRSQQPRSSHGANLRGGELQRPPPARLGFLDAIGPRGNSNREFERSLHLFRMERLTREHDQGDVIHSSSPLPPYQDPGQASHRHATLDTRPRSFRSSTGFRNPEHEFRPPHSMSPRSLDATPFHHERLPPPIEYDLLNHNPHRSPPPTQPAPNSRRPPIPLRVASRRISASQHNQENSMDAEHGAMRNELQAAGMRYAGSGVGQDVMDETPPKVGRFERAGYMVAD